MMMSRPVGPSAGTPPRPPDKIVSCDEERQSGTRPCVPAAGAVHGRPPAPRVGDPTRIGAGFGLRRLGDGVRSTAKLLLVLARVSAAALRQEQAAGELKEVLLNGAGSCPPAGAACGRSGLYEKCPLAEVHLRRARWFLMRTARRNGPCTPSYPR